MHQKWIIMFLACVWNRKIARFGAEMSEKVNNRVWRATFGTSSKPAKRNGNRSSSTYALELRFCNRSHNHFSNFNCSCETCPKFGSVCRVAAAHPEFMVLPVPPRKKSVVLPQIDPGKTWLIKIWTESNYDFPKPSGPSCHFDGICCQLQFRGVS